MRLRYHNTAATYTSVKAPIRNPLPKITHQRKNKNPKIQKMAAKTPSVLSATKSGAGALCRCTGAVVLPLGLLALFSCGCHPDADGKGFPCFCAQASLEYGDRGRGEGSGWDSQDLVGNLFSILLYALFAIPVGCYVFGLVGGSIHRRRTQVDRQGLEKTAGSFRMIPDVSVYTVLVMVGVVYLVFIGLQFGYLFAALAGQFPGAYESYAEYARAGFFELCAVAAFNGVLLLAAGCLSKKSGRESGMLRLLNLAISVMTLLLLATAMSKMALYVDAYGLSVRRVLPSWFMIFMGLCCVLVMVLQFKHFSIVRGIAVLGSVMFVLLCLTDVGGLVAGYNLRRYQEGSLPNLSMEFLYDCGYGGISPAQELYQQTDDPVIRQELEDYLERMQIHAYYDNEHWESMTVQSLIAQSRLQNFGES